MSAVRIARLAARELGVELLRTADGHIDFDPYAAAPRGPVGPFDERHAAYGDSPLTNSERERLGGGGGGGGNS